MKSFSVRTGSRTEFVDITDKVALAVSDMGVKDGLVTADSYASTTLLDYTNTHFWYFSIADPADTYLFYCDSSYFDPGLTLRGLDDTIIAVGVTGTIYTTEIDLTTLGLETGTYVLEVVSDDPPNSGNYDVGIEFY